MQRALSMSLSLLLLTVPALGAGTPEIVCGERGRKLDQAVREFPGIEFSGSVLCARDGVVYLAKGYGLADRARKIPNTTVTLFDIGSVAKQHTAAAVLLLADWGLLSVTDTLDRHLEGVPEDKAKITLHQLLTHTSGLARGMAREKIRPEIHTSREAFIRAVMAEPLESKPGDELAYNNMAYMLLAAIVERVSGEDFGPFLKRHLFHALLMTDTGYCGDVSLDEELASRRYTGPGGTADGSAIEYSFSWLNRGATSIVTNVWDMVRWSRAVLDDAVLSRPSMDVWFEPVMDHHACGWMRRPGVGNRPKISHGGHTRGFHTVYSIYPEENAVVVILANSMIAREKANLSRKLEELLLAGTGGAPTSGGPAIEGRYRVLGESSFEVVRRGDLVLLRARGQPAVDRLVHGASRDPEKVEDLRPLNRRAEKLFKALVRGRRKDFEREFAEGRPRHCAEAVLERFKACGKKLGRARTVEPVGSCDPGSGAVTWVESIHRKGVAYWRVRWGEEGPVGVSYAGRHFPFEIPLAGSGAGVHVGRGIVKGSPLRVSFKVSRGKVSALVWEKVEGLPAKRKECRRLK